MLQPRIPLSKLSVRDTHINTLASTFCGLSVSCKHIPRNIAQSLPSRSQPHTQIRFASHAAQGRANGPKDSAGRRLGAKKTASEYVIPGNIIFKQRGTKWFPGENVGIGKDHTIYAKVAGYVRYYRNPAIHPKRRYIGVALEREGQGSQLPTPPNAITRRRLGMHAAPMKPVSPPTSASQSSTTTTANETVITGLQPAKGENIFVDRSSISLSTPPPLARRSDGLGIAGFEIGRAAERKGIHVKEFDRSDRWLAWRIRGKKMKEKLAQRQAKKTKKTKGKKSNKMVV